jgi:DNA topoisomerase IA
MKKLLLLESPSKCKIIQAILGSEWQVEASFGHLDTLRNLLKMMKITWAILCIQIPTKLNLISAQRARQCLDRLIGFNTELSG